MLKKIMEKKVKQEEEARAYAFQEFIEEFQSDRKIPCKTFVRSGVLKGNTEKVNSSDKGNIYNVKPFLKIQSEQTVKSAIECARLIKETKPEKPKGRKRPKSNLEILKEEMKKRHTESIPKIRAETMKDENDSETTNLFLTNLSPKLTEDNLKKLFGVYGPLASTKIMWPRGEERHYTNNCGFVAFMSRKDAERALEDVRNRLDMRVSWGKRVEIPTHPIYIPPQLLKLSRPPPRSGLPFNAQPFDRDFKFPENHEELNDLLYRSYVKVTIPSDKQLLALINRTVEFVVREGPTFEALIMTREIENPCFAFLFNNTSQVHIYYRWKLYSILQGENPRFWSIKNFRMYKDGPIWVPPVIPDYTLGMPENLIDEKSSTVDESKKLSNAQAERFNKIIQKLSLTKSSVGQAKVFCLNHIDAAKDICYILSDSLKNSKTIPTKKIARLYLLSDILCNSTNENHIKNEYCLVFEKELPSIFLNLQRTSLNLENFLDKEAFKSRVLNVLRAWNLFKTYPNEKLRWLEKVFLFNDSDEDSDNEIVNGGILLKRPTVKITTPFLTIEKDVESSEKKEKSSENLTNKKMNVMPPGFIPSKWETIDPEEVEAQAMSTKKIFALEMKREKSKVVMKKSEKERELLREIEVKVMQYQDDIESGKLKLNSDITLEQEVDNYRKKLKAKYEKKANNSKKSSSDEDEVYSISLRKFKKKYHKRRPYKDY